MARVPDFTYGQPLRGQNIRLVKIKLDSQMSTLKINLTEHNLEDVKFEAISYVWGERSNIQRIECNGRSMYIGESIIEVFWELVRRQSTGFIWADAICINQNDEIEKTRQVRMMRNIYKKAHRVIIWLGKGLAHDERGFHLAKTLYDTCGGARYNIAETTYDFDMFDCESKGVPKPLGSEDWEALFAILSHPWFSRVWVVQELLVARSSIIWRGALDLKTYIVVWITMQIARHKNLYESFDIFMGSPPISALLARNIATGYIEFTETGPLSIYDTLSRYNGMKATDPRDRYFALAGISRIDAKFINYEKSFRDIACLVGKMTLLGLSGYTFGSGGTEILFCNDKPEAHMFLLDWLTFHANPQNHLLGLPSWIPDLISPHSPGLIMSGFYNTMYLRNIIMIPLPKVRLRYRGGDWSGSSLPLPFIPVPDEIEIMGAIFDCVGILANERPPYPQPTSRCRVDILEAMEDVSQYESDMVYWLSEIRTLIDSSIHIPDSIMSGTPASFDAFWRSLVYNRGPQFNYQSPNMKSDLGLGISFGYWYLWKKLRMKRLWKQNICQDAIFSNILTTLAKPFEEAEGRVCNARRFFVSNDGRFGWVPLRTQIGDHVCVFQGMRIPIILRSHNNRWEVIGACYVHGLMDGELWKIAGLEYKFISFV